ncbi:ribosomal protein S6 kinase-related protein [Ictalurus furcatus]|uniref:ribosomal protein S6 kinase-related protein n=1 Tax=Ictalurus furcatus TaxID=66913 RepID=UPI00235082F6|nr:ribosomal protein S6 kinase-related protein [Ictalurus furcatus]
MGGAVSRNKTPFSSVEKRCLSSEQRFPSLHDVLVDQSSPFRQQSDQCTTSHICKCTKRQETNPLPTSTSIFLPEFPHRDGRPTHLQVTGVIAKGSFGPILKVKDWSKEKTYAIKVLPKSEVLRHGVLEQSKEEVKIQRQLKHTFVLGLEDCWQSQNNLFIMCDYCSTGDLYTYWMLTGQFKEREVQVFAAELGSALGFLHDFGVMHRDLKMENILLTDQGHVCLADFGLSRRLERGEKAFTICGTIQYMAPEVLTGGPYSHAADWWSLGILLYTLAAGEFPLPPESDHSSMLTKVTEYPYEMPLSFSPALALLLTELLCKTPMHRLRCLERYMSQRFFNGVSFDSQVLMKIPIQPILELKDHPNRPEKSMRGLTYDQLQNFECNLFEAPSSNTDLSPAIPHQH